MTSVQGIEPQTSRSQVEQLTTEPRTPLWFQLVSWASRKVLKILQELFVGTFWVSRGPFTAYGHPSFV